MRTSGGAAPQCGKNVNEEKKCRSGERRSQEEEEGRTGVRRPQEMRPQGGWYSRGYLPHFDSSHIIQHITCRLADSLPLAALERLQELAATVARDDPAREAEVRRQLEAYLDAGYGSCVLRESQVAACIVETWQRFDGERYRLLEWVVMPNHCHVLIEPLPGYPLGKIVLSWKNFTARFINEYLGRSGERRSRQSSQVWQREYWDRFVRDERHLAEVVEYIRQNPVKAGLVAKPEDWPWSSAGVGVERDGKK